MEEYLVDREGVELTKARLAETQARLADPVEIAADDEDPVVAAEEGPL